MLTNTPLVSHCATSTLRCCITKPVARTRKQKVADIALMVFGMAAAIYTTAQTVHVSDSLKFITSVMLMPVDSSCLHPRLRQRQSSDAARPLKTKFTVPRRLVSPIDDMHLSSYTRIYWYGIDLHCLYKDIVNSRI